MVVVVVGLTVLPAFDGAWVVLGRVWPIKVVTRLIVVSVGKPFRIWAEVRRVSGTLITIAVVLVVALIALLREDFCAWSSIG